MQKEDLIKRLRLFATITTTLFVVLIITLLVQFGFIAYYHNQVKHLQDRNDELSQQIEDIKDELTYYKDGEGSKDNA